MVHISDLNNNAIRIIDKENRQYIDSPEEAPDDVQVEEGEKPGVYYYIPEGSGEVNTDYEIDFDQNPFKEYDGVRGGDKVAIEVENGIFEGVVTDVDADESGSYYYVENDNGEGIWTSSGNITITNPRSPDNGEQIELSDYSIGDEIFTVSSTDITGVVTNITDSGEVEVIDSDGFQYTVSAKERAARGKTKNNQSASNYSLTTNIESDNFKNEREIRNYISDNIMPNTKNDNIGRNITDNINKITHPSDKNAWDAQNNELHLTNYALHSPEVIAHEYAHALADSYGYDTDPESKLINIFAKIGVNNFTPINFNKPLGESLKESLAELEEQREDFEVTDGIAQMIESDAFDSEIKREDFHLTRYKDGKEPTEEIEILINEVNNTWDEIRDYVNDGEYNKADIRTPLRPYVATNSHEMLAGVQEIAQSTDGKETHLQTIYEYHPDLLKAYLEIMDPSPEAKKFLNGLHNDLDQDVFDDIPFPGVEE